MIQATNRTHMRVVYEPANLIDAHLVKGVLEQAGVPVYLRGEHLAGGMGELPVIGLFALCVPEAYEPEAREALEVLLGTRASGPAAEDEDGMDWIAIPV